MQAYDLYISAMVRCVVPSGRFQMTEEDLPRRVPLSHASELVETTTEVRDADGSTRTVSGMEFAETTPPEERRQRLIP